MDFENLLIIEIYELKPNLINKRENQNHINGN